MENKARFQWQVRPLALAENTVTAGCGRFTVLTPALLRLEYDPAGIFEDRASQTAFYRDFPKCEFTVSRQDGILILRTQALELTYRADAPFAADTLHGIVYRFGRLANSFCDLTARETIQIIP